uniref:Nck-associated protein 5 n=3 Tax=Lygus hesperus TaxID=30085 RepID=A0A146LUL8_LYGHE
MGTNASKTGKLQRECLARDVTDASKAKEEAAIERLEQARVQAEGTVLRLHALQQTVNHLEDSLRVMSTYKTQHSLLLAENENLKTSIENKTVQFQSALNRLSAENEELRTRLHALESTGSEREAALWRRLRAAEEENARLTAERDKCEKCLDQVAHGVVQALLSQKGLGEEITSLREKVKELEKQNYALSSLLLHNVPKVRPVHTTLDAVIRPLSCDDGRLRWKDESNGLLWTHAHRPSSLNLDAQPSLLATLTGECHKDEGYSTMSSEVQDGAPSQGQGPLERLQEENCGRLGEDTAEDLGKRCTVHRSSSDSALLTLGPRMSPLGGPSLPLCLLICEEVVNDWWEPALCCEPDDDAVPPPPELEEWNMDDIPGMSFLDLDEEDVWSAVDSWSSGQTTASSSLGASNGGPGVGGCLSKRSSGAESAATGVSAMTPGDSEGVGTTSFTRDFYRLVKFESNKSLASTSSKSQVSECGGGRDSNFQNVLQFIAQQQCVEDAKESDSEPLSLSDRSACTTAQTTSETIGGNSNSSGVSSDEQQVTVKPSESWGLLTVPEEEPETSDDKASRKDSGNLEESPLRAANTLAELERIVAPDGGEDEEEDRNKTKEPEEEKAGGKEWRPTGWVHLHRAELSDPKTRANYADLVMLASRSSSSCSGSSESGDDHSPYSQLHRLHRSRRHKKASATRDGAIRIHVTPRLSIVGREDIFTRFGAKEAEAVASFDFLEELEAETPVGPN